MKKSHQINWIEKTEAARALNMCVKSFVKYTAGLTVTNLGAKIFYRIDELNELLEGNVSHRKAA